jgi:hypothetical protein
LYGIREEKQRDLIEYKTVELKTPPFFLIIKDYFAKKI